MIPDYISSARRLLGIGHSVTRHADGTFTVSRVVGGARIETQTFSSLATFYAWLRSLEDTS